MPLNRIILYLLLLSVASTSAARIPAPDIQALLESSCLDCHDSDTDTGLDLESLDYNLTDPAIFRHWEAVYDRVTKGEMPPKKKPRPDTKLSARALNALHDDLHSANHEARKKNGRVPVRRLTRTEYEYTLHDLLGINNALAKHLPPENDSARFDTIASDQGISPVHIQSYLTAADQAINEAIKLGRRPYMKPRLVDYRNSKYVNRWFERPLRRGGRTIKKLDDAVVTFDSKPHALQSNHMGYKPRYSGRYRIEVDSYAYQAKTPVTLTLIQASDQQGGARLIGAWDLYPGKPRTVSVETFMNRDDYFYPAVADLDWDSRGKSIYAAKGGAETYDGEGVAIKRLTLQGPLEENWPPASTRNLLVGIRFKDRGQWFQPELSKTPLEHITEIVAQLAPRTFRRPSPPAEIKAFADLAKPALAKGTPFHQALRIPLRALLSSPQFLYQSSDPGRLNDYALASRLSYFLWKSLPDDALFKLAEQSQLSQPEILEQQVNRMLNDEKSMRFIEDFLGQWVGLHDIDATTPDDKLYPEYDDVLRQSMLRETTLFFRDLIANNGSTRNLIHSDYTFLNRRLAEHYGIPGVDNEQFRKVSLPQRSVRGGLLTQASILKVTANGTVTSPVKRGTFVLSTLLGIPPNPPPPNIGSIEPDTRGTTTIRETLDAHRNIEACASCHRTIDPPGFALESFDPIGGYRTRYRSSDKGDWPSRRIFGRRAYEYKEGPPVDPSGVTSDGETFNGVRDFKKLLLKKEDTVARNVLANLIVYATGGEIEFSDRKELDEMLLELKKNDYPLRSMIHHVVQSKLFRNK